MHLLRFGGAGGQQKAEIGSGRDIARAHAHEFGGEIGARCKPADADMLAMLATRGNGPGIGIAQACVLVLAGKAPQSARRSFDPIMTRSTPSTAAIASAWLSASSLSNWTMSSVA
jgi:hypothetical protein